MANVCRSADHLRVRRQRSRFDVALRQTLSVAQSCGRLDTSTEKRRCGSSACSAMRARTLLRHRAMGRWKEKYDATCRRPLHYFATTKAHMSAFRLAEESIRMNQHWVSSSGQRPKPPRWSSPSRLNPGAAGGGDWTGPSPLSLQEKIVRSGTCTTLRSDLMAKRIRRHRVTQLA